MKWVFRMFFLAVVLVSAGLCAAVCARWQARGGRALAWLVLPPPEPVHRSPVQQVLRGGWHLTFSEPRSRATGNVTRVTPDGWCFIQGWSRSPTRVGAALLVYDRHQGIFAGTPKGLLRVDSADPSGLGKCRILRDDPNGPIAEGDVLTDTGAYFAIPYRVAVGVLATLASPLVWLTFALIAAARRVRRARNGQCLKCGYDLRASAGRCPECGAVPAGAKGAI